MPSFLVSTAFTAKDRVTQAFKRMGKGADKFGSRSSNAFKKATKSASTFGKTVKRVLGAGVLIGGIVLLKRGIGAVTNEFISFDQAITASSAKFKDLKLNTEAGQKSLLQLKKTARDVGAATQFSATEAAQGLDFLAMAGFSAKQSMALLPGVVDLATVANVDLARSTDIASDTIGAFGLMTKDTAQLTENFARVNDVMAKTMVSANADMETIFESVKKGAPSFTAAGQSMETFSALLGVMANSGVKGAEAGTSLRNVMLRLADPSKEAQKVLEKLNITTQDSQGNFRDVVDIISDFEKGLKGMGTKQKTAALSTVFGARAVTGFNILLKEGTQSIRGFRGELESSTGASKKMAEVMRQSLQNRLASLSSAAIELGFKFFTAFEKDGGGAIDFLTNAVRNFDVKPIIAGIKSVIEILKPLAPIVVDIAKIAIGGLKFFLPFFMLGIKTIAAGIKIVIGFIDNLFSKFSIFKGIKSFFGGLRDTATSLTQAPTDRATAAFTQQTAARAAPPQAPVVAPNQTEIEARQKIDFKGMFEFKNAPDGSTVTGQTTGAPDIGLELLGVNP